MTPPQVAPYGSWRSPISAAAVARAAVRFGSLAVDGEDVYWVEGRPDEGGRSVRWRGRVLRATGPPPRRSRVFGATSRAIAASGDSGHREGAGSS